MCVFGTVYSDIMRGIVLARKDSFLSVGNRLSQRLIFPFMAD